VTLFVKHSNLKVKTMLEFFKNLDTFQIMLLLGAAALFAPELLEKLKGFLKDAAVEE